MNLNFRLSLSIAIRQTHGRGRISIRTILVFQIFSFLLGTPLSDFRNIQSSKEIERKPLNLKNNQTDAENNLNRSHKKQLSGNIQLNGQETVQELVQARGFG
jgi:hypothetical protein